MPTVADDGRVRPLEPRHLASRPEDADAALQALGDELQQIIDSYAAEKVPPALNSLDERGGDSITAVLHVAAGFEAIAAEIRQDVARKRDEQRQGVPGARRQPPQRRRRRDRRR